MHFLLKMTSPRQKNNKICKIFALVVLSVQNILQFYLNLLTAIIKL